MNFPAAPLSKLFCAAAFGVFVVGCTATPNNDLAANAVGNAVGNTATNAAGSTPDAANATVNFTSTPQGLKGKLKENYTDFSFEYPKTWEVKEAGQSEGAQNFVKVERGLEDESKGPFTLENFAVGYFSSTGDSARNATLYPKLVAQLSAQFQKGFPNYQKISEGKTKIGNLDAYEFRFQSKLTKTDRGPITLWGRAVLLPQPKTKKGVALIMLASNLVPEIKSARDVGEKGQLPAILKSFKFGEKPASDLKN